MTLEVVQLDIRHLLSFTGSFAQLNISKNIDKFIKNILYSTFEE